MTAAGASGAPGPAVASWRLPRVVQFANARDVVEQATAALDDVRSGAVGVGPPADPAVSGSAPVGSAASGSARADFARADFAWVDFDLSACEAFDSSLLAVLLELGRRARQRGLCCRFASAPDKLRELADLYGAAALLFAVSTAQDARGSSG